MKRLIEKLTWTTSEDILALAHSDTRGGMPLIPPGMRSLAGTGLDLQQGVMMMLHDDAGKVVGFGTELENLPPLGSVGTSLEVFFTIVLPGRGSLFIFETKRYDAPEMVELFDHVRSTGSPWSGELPIISTNGPKPDSRGSILHGTGEFEGATGEMFQTMTFREIRPHGPPVVRSTETLLIDLSAS
jgi:hypothetical protein